MVLRISVFQVQKDVDAWKSVVAPLELVSLVFIFFSFPEMSLRLGFSNKCQSLGRECRENILCTGVFSIVQGIDLLLVLVQELGSEHFLGCFIEQ